MLQMVHWVVHVNRVTKLDIIQEEKYITESKNVLDDDSNPIQISNGPCIDN